MRFAVLRGLVLLLSCLVARIAAAEGERKNVVFILADDLGWSDTTLYGTTELYRTPHIERLARRGMTFTRAYSSSPLCSPTRASILTGLGPARHGITSPTCHLPRVQLDPDQGKTAPASAKSVPVNSATRLRTEHYTLAEALRDAGYATGHFGKWHLGHSPYSPLEHGFDIDVPHWPGPGPAGSYVAPWRFPDFDPDTPNQHIEDRMAREAVSFIEKHRARPFFLNYWMFSVHAPFDAKRSLVEKYRKRVDPKDEQRSPTYAAMIESLDDAVGTLLSALDRWKLAERTIIVFASDNGGNMYNEVDGTTPTSDRPLRGGKATLFEGGIRGPCSIVWPGVVAPGSRSDALVQSSDFYPTLLEALGLEARPGQRFDGVSLVPTLEGKGFDRDRAIFTYFPHMPRVPDWLPPAVSVHRGDWKLIRIFHGGEAGAHRHKLFDLRTDPGERNDLADEIPARVKELDALIDAHLRETEAVTPIPNPLFDPSKYRPESEGKAIPRSSRRGPRKASSAGPVAGWTALHHCRLAWRDQTLVISSNGRDPYLRFEMSKPLPSARFELSVKMRSNARGRAQLFWQEVGARPAFVRDRSKSFPVVHDGNLREYRVSIEPSGPVTAFRFDPAQSEGEIQVSDVRVIHADGETVSLLEKPKPSR